jgi:aspartate/methionine/tyrosine aminotransferase
MTASDAESVTIEDLLSHAHLHDRETFEKQWLRYVPPAGGEVLRSAIAQTYTSATGDDILTFAGGGEAIYVALHSLLESSDHAIVITPTYQSLESVALSICHTTGVALNAENGWTLDLQEVRDQIRPNTRLMAINFPNNPTGGVIPQEDFNTLVQICGDHSLWLLSDEVYRLMERPLSRRLPAAVDCYERGLSLSVMSKVYGLPGLRIGWIAAHDRNLLQRMERIKHYLSICNSAPGESLAVIALKSGERLLDRNRSLINTNLGLVAHLLRRFPELFEWEEPDAGMTAYPRYKGRDGVEAFTRRLVEEAGVLLLPATIYQSELTPLPKDRFRIGFGRSYVPEGLEAMRDWLERNNSVDQAS